MQENLDIRHVSIIDALPVFEAKKEVLTVGCGNGILESALQSMGYNVYATDISATGRNKENLEKLNFTESNILDLDTFPVTGAETVICSEVLEHILDWKTAFQNLLRLTDRRLIITVPYRESFNDTAPPPEGHCNFWTDLGNDPLDYVMKASKNTFMPIGIFARLAWPHHVSVTKICTKYDDWIMASRCYMLIIDKIQLSEYCITKTQAHTIFIPEKLESGRYQVNSSIHSKAVQTPKMPPLQYGPPLPYTKACGHHDFTVFVPPYQGKSREKFVNQLSMLEYVISDLGLRFTPVFCDEKIIDLITNNIHLGHLITGRKSPVLVNFHYALPNELMKAMTAKSKFLVCNNDNAQHEEKIYSKIFKAGEMTQAEWEYIAAESLK